MVLNELLIKNKIKFIGRTYIKDNMLYMNFSGSGFMVNAKTNKLVFKFTGTKYNDANSCPYISILIDDERYDYPINEEIKTISLELDNNPHIIKVIKRTESSVSYAMLVDINCDEFLEVRNDNKLNIEFYGDSITCGYGVLCNDPTKPFTTSTESFLDTYAYLTTKELNANYSAICVSGFPIYKSRWNLGFPIDSVLDMLSISDYSEDMSFHTAIKWDNSNYKPDIVIINLGTNDCSYFTEGQDWVDDLIKKHGSFDNVLQLDEFNDKLLPMKDKIYTFLDNIFNLYGDVKIIWTLGMMYVNPHVENIIDAAIKEYNNKNVYNFKFHSLEKSNDLGANYHPGKTMHIDAKDELVNYINTVVLGGDR